MRQRCHGFNHARAQMLWRLTFAMAFGGKLHFAHGFKVEVEDIGRRRIKEADFDGPILIGLVPRFVELRFLGQVARPEASILDVFFKLFRVGRAAPLACSVFPAKACKRANAFAAFVADNVVRIVGIFLAAVLVDKARQAEPRSEIT